MADVLVIIAVAAFVALDAGADPGTGPDMTAVQEILLALSITVFIYLGVARFKAEWFC